MVWLTELDTFCIIINHELIADDLSLPLKAGTNIRGQSRTFYQIRAADDYDTIKNLTINQGLD